MLVTGQHYALGYGNDCRLFRHDTRSAAHPHLTVAKMRYSHVLFYVGECVLHKREAEFEEQLADEYHTRTCNIAHWYDVVGPHSLRGAAVIATEHKAHKFLSTSKRTSEEIWVLPSEIDTLVHLSTPEDIRERIGCGNPRCSRSSGICGAITFGWGDLDEYGYWEFPCRICAAGFEKWQEKEPDITEPVTVWPREIKAMACSIPDD